MRQVAWGQRNGYFVGQFPTGHYPLARFAPGTYPIGQWRLARRGRLGALGHDTPDSIRLYVPRLASAMHAMMLRESGLTYGAVAHAPFETVRWNNELATEFAHQARKYLGFTPVVHEPLGADVVYAHMLGAETHAEAEQIWGALQAAIALARASTGTPAVADPTAGRPRPWEAPGPPPGPPGPPPADARRDGIIQLVVGLVSLVGGIAIL